MPAPTSITLEVVTETPEPRELVVFAASSLTDAFTEAVETFEAANPGVTVTFSFASSSDLATQLSEGAPADVFASANARQMQVAADGGRIAGAPVNFLTNRLAIIVPSGNPAGVESLADLKKEGLRLVLAAPDVPIRGFAEQVLDKAAADHAFGATFKEDVLAQLVSEEANVRQVVAKVSLGEADAGIVYISDVTPDLASSIVAITIPAELNVLAVYPIAVTNDSKQAELAQAFVDFILSEDGQAILNKWGFGPKPE
jgi:molybdate transport system substrate-binding protein